MRKVNEEGERQSGRRKRRDGENEEMRGGLKPD